MNWFTEISRKLSGAEARERIAAEEAQIAIEQQQAAEYHQLAGSILTEHDAREHFGAQEALDRLNAAMPEATALEHYGTFLRSKIEPVLQAALADDQLTPEEDERIQRVRARYGNFKIDEEAETMISAARSISSMECAVGASGHATAPKAQRVLRPRHTGRSP